MIRSRSSSTVLVLALALASGGCSGGESGSSGQGADSGPPTDAGDEGEGEGAGPVVLQELPASPAPPAPPELPACLSGPSGCVRLESWTCPTGWRPVTHDRLLDPEGASFAWCQPPLLPPLRVGPYLTAEVDEATTDLAHAPCDPLTEGVYPLIGQADCAPLGDTCPASGWPDVPASVHGARWYVRAGTVEGTGTAEAPFGTIAAALDQAASGDVVILAPGTYAEAIHPTRDVTIWGACVSRVTLEPPGPFAGKETGAVLLDAPVQVRLRNLHVTGPQIGVRMRDAGARLTVEGTLIERTTRDGLYITGGALELDGVVVAATLPVPAGFETAGSYGRGLILERGARGRVTRSLFEANQAVGLGVIDPDSTVRLQQVAIRATQASEADGVTALGLGAEACGEVVLRQVLIADSAMSGIRATVDPTVLDLQDVVIAGTRADGLNQGFGLGLGLGVQAQLRRVLLLDNAREAIDAQGRASLTDVVLQGTRAVPIPGTATYFGMGLGVVWGAQVDVHGMLVEDVQQAGVVVAKEGASLGGEDLVVRRTTADPGGGGGAGLSVMCRGQVGLTRVLVEESQGAGLQVDSEPLASDPLANLIDAPAILTLDRLTVRGTGSIPTGEHAKQGGIGILAANGGRLVVNEALIQDNRHDGISAGNPGTEIEVADVHITGTEVQEADGLWGVGLTVVDAAQATVERVLLAENRTAGVEVAGGAEVALHDVTIRDTRGDGNGEFGRGLIVQQGGQVRFERGVVRANHDAGIFVASAGTTLDLSDVEISDTASQEVDLLGGRGLDLQGGAQARLERVLLAGNRELGIYVGEQDTSAILRDVQVTGTRPRGCTEVPDSDTRHCDARLGFGAGLGVYAAGLVQDSHRVVLDQQRSHAALQLARGGRCGIEFLRVTDNAVGVDLQDLPTDYDFWSYQPHLWQQGNATNLSTTPLPVPDVGIVAPEPGPVTGDAAGH